MKLRSYLSSSLAIALLLTQLGYAEAKRLTLGDAIKTAAAQNPELAALDAETKAARAVHASSPSLPPPTLFIGAMGTAPLRSSGQMENSFGVSQTFPFPTKLISESKTKRLEADAADARLKSRMLDLRATTKSAFFSLYGARKKIDLLVEKSAIFNEHNQRLRATSLSDRIMQAHRVWVKTEIDLNGNDIIAAREDEQVARGKLNIAMGKDPELPIPELEEVPVSDLPQGTELSATHPELNSLVLYRNAAESAATEANALWLPDLSITYRNARRFDGLMPNYTEVTVGATLPFLFFWETKGKANAANARAESAVFKVESTRQDLKMDLLESRTRAESLRAQLLNYDSKILPQAEKRMKIAHGLVPSDMETLSEHRGAMESLVNLRLSELSLRVNYEKANARLESLLNR